MDKNYGKTKTMDKGRGRNGRKFLNVGRALQQRVKEVCD